MVLPASCPHSVVVNVGNCRCKVKVPTAGGQWSQMTCALRRNKLCARIIYNHAPAEQMNC